MGLILSLCCAYLLGAVIQAGVEENIGALNVVHFAVMVTLVVVVILAAAKGIAAG